MNWKLYYIMNNIKKRQCYEKKILWSELTKPLQDSLKKNGCNTNFPLILTICEYDNGKPKAPNRHRN